MPVVQEELKMTDKQKEQVKAVLAEADKKRNQVRENAQKMATVANEQAAMQAAQEAQFAQANAIAQANKAAEANAFSSNTGGFGGGGGGNQGQVAIQGQAQGGRGGRTNGRNSAGNQLMQQTMDNFEKQVETTVLKTLEPKQKIRIKQIALQAEGAGAFNNPEVIQALGMTQDQVMAIQGVRNDSRQAQGALMGQFFTAMREAGNNNGGDNAGGGRGRGNRPDPATFQTPEFQAKLKTMQEGQEKLTDQTMATVGKALTKAQRAKFNGMIGEKFDITKLRQGFMARFQPGGAAPGTPATATATATATPAAATPAPATAAAETKEAVKTPAPTRGSLRASRSGNP